MISDVTAKVFQIFHDFLSLQEVSSYGQAPCYISVDRDTGYLHVANYFDNYTSYKIDKTSGLFHRVINL